jgi:hypothetical protein
MKMARMNAIERQLHRRLKGRVFSGLIWYSQQGTFVLCFSIPVAILMLFGPIAGRTDHNAIRYLAGPFICPFTAACCLTVFPFKPYRGSPFDGHKAEPVDSSDPAIKRLVALFASHSAKIFIWRAAIKLSCMLFVIMATLAFLIRQSLSWSLESSWFIYGLLGCSLFCWLAIGAQSLGWGFAAWLAESQEHGD